MNTISWSSPTTPLPMEINPRVVFERLFGRPGTPARARGAHAARTRASSISSRSRPPICSAARRARPGAAGRVSRQHPRDRAAHPAGRGADSTDVPASTLPVGVPESFEEHVGADVRPAGGGVPGGPDARVHVHDARELSQRTYPQIGVTEQHHTVSHHGNDPDEHRARSSRSTPTTSSCSRKFLDKLQATPDGDGSLLDHSLIFYGGGMGNPNQHASDPLPLLAVGGGVGTGNRHIQLAPRTPVGNLWLSVAKRLRRRDRHASARATGRVDLFAVSLRPAVAGAVVAFAAGASHGRRRRRARGSSTPSRPAIATRCGRCCSRRDVNAAEADGTTALHWAVRADDLRDRRACCSRRRRRERREPLRRDAAVAGRAQRQRRHRSTRCSRPAPTPTARCRTARRC